MSNIYTDELYGNILPRVYINKITLENSGYVQEQRDPHVQPPIPSSDSQTQIVSLQSAPRLSNDISTLGSLEENMQRIIMQQPPPAFNVTLNLQLKQQYTDDVVGKWFKNQDFKKYLRIKLIQVSDETISALFSFTKDCLGLLVPINNFAALNIGRRVLKLSPRQDFYAVINQSIVTRDLSVSNQEQTFSEILDDGTEIFNISLKETFGIPKQDVQHLSYFCMAYLDAEALAADFSITPDNEFKRFLFGLSTVTSEIVIDEYKPVNYTYVFTDNNFKIWTGNVNEENGEYYTGIEKTEDSFPLIRRKISNSTLQDNRSFKQLNKTLTANNFERYFQKFQKISSENTLPVNTNHSFVSPISITVNTKKAANIAFSIDMKSLLLEKSRFSYLIKKFDNDLANDIVENNELPINILMHRERVKEERSMSNGIGLEKKYSKFSKNEPREILFHTKLSYGTIISNDSIFLKATKEEGINVFKIVDKKASSLTDGLYQYSLDIQFLDPFVSYIKKQILQLANCKKLMLEYYLEAERPTILKSYSKNTDAHTKEISPQQTRNTRLEPNYNIYTETFTPRFRQTINDNYNNSYIGCVAVYMTIVSKLFDLATREKEEITEAIQKTISPITGSPNGILQFLKLIEQLYSNLAALIGDSLRADLLSEAADSSNKEMILYSHKFKNDVFDANLETMLELDYLDTRDNGQELKEITVSEYDAIITRETTKYYTTDNPNTDNLLAIGNSDSLSFSTNEYSYLTPNSVRMGSVKVSSAPTTDNENNQIMSNMLAASKTISNLSSVKSLKDENFANDVFTYDLQQKYNLTIEVFSVEQKAKPARIPAPGRLAAAKTPEPDQEQVQPKERIVARFGDVPEDKAEPLKGLVSIFGNIAQNNKSINRENTRQKINTSKPDKEKEKIPNQVRAILGGDAPSDNRKATTPDKTLKDFAKSITQETLYVGSVKEVQILTGYKKDEKGRSIMNDPMWETLTKEKVSTLPAGQEALCRLADYSNKDIKTNDITKSGTVVDKTFTIIGERPIPEGAIETKEVELNVGSSVASVDRKVAETALKNALEQQQYPASTTTSNPVSEKTVEQVLKDPAIAKEVAEKQSQRISTTAKTTKTNIRNNSRVGR